MQITTALFLQMCLCLWLCVYLCKFRTSLV
uniref:Uncharacterized protein n=1 Tax=Arundo donax TaxID=35708 RepID=A0A0A9GBP5_ARUDO